MTCKPCLTIRLFFFLLKKNYVQFRKDLRDYSLVNYYACEITERGFGKPMTMPEDKLVQNIREMAQKNYNEDILK
jgi:hypothetical protein